MYLCLSSLLSLIASVCVATSSDLTGREFTKGSGGEPSFVVTLLLAIVWCNRSVFIPQNTGSSRAGNDVYELRVALAERR